MGNGNNTKNVKPLRCPERLQKYGYVLPVLLIPFVFILIVWSERSIGCAGSSAESGPLLCGSNDNLLTAELAAASSLSTKEHVLAEMNRENREKMQARVVQMLRAMWIVEFLAARTARTDTRVVQAATAAVGQWPFGMAWSTFDSALKAELQRTQLQAERVVTSEGGNQLGEACPPGLPSTDSQQAGQPVEGAGVGQPGPPSTDSQQAGDKCAPRVPDKIPDDIFTMRKNLKDIADEGVGALLRSAARDEIKQGISVETKRYLAGIATTSEASDLWLARIASQSGAYVTYRTSYVVLMAALVVTLVLGAETFWRSAWGARSGHQTRRQPSDAWDCREWMRWTFRLASRVVVFIGLLTAGYVFGSQVLSPGSSTLTQFALDRLPEFRQEMVWTDRIGLGALLVALAAITISVVASNKEVRAWNDKKVGADRAEKIARNLARSWDDIQRVAIALSALLVGVILYAQALLNWPLSLLGGCKDGTTASGVDGICRAASQMVTGYGVISSLLLGSLFIPAVVILRGRSDWLARSVSGSGSVTISQWLEERRLNVSLSQQVGRLVTVMAPFLAAMYGNQLQGMLGLTGP